MDKAVLIEYADMKEEIKDLRRRIDEDKRAINKLEKEIVTDSVSCGKKGKKPIKTVKIQGFASSEAEKKRSALKTRIMQLELLEASLLEKQNEVEEYIQQIKKSELRIMFRLHFVDNLTWYQVAIKMNNMHPKRRVKYTEDNCRIRCDRFLKKG